MTQDSDRGSIERNTDSRKIDVKPDKILSRKVFEAGYEVRELLVDGKKFGGKDFKMKSAFNIHGDYIGSPEDAHKLCTKRGIAPILRTKDSNVCSIGFSTKDEKWYGWSHRAIYGFKVGSQIKVGDCGYTPSKGNLEAKTLQDAKQMAMNFADGVS